MVLRDHNSNCHPLLKFLLESDNYQQSRGDCRLLMVESV